MILSKLKYTENDGNATYQTLRSKSLGEKRGSIELQGYDRNQEVAGPYFPMTVSGVMSHLVSNP